MILVWLPSANVTRDAQLDYIAQDSFLATIDQNEKIAKQVKMLLDHPSMGRPGRVKTTHELVIGQTSFIVAYRVRDQRIEILRVLHGSQQRPGNMLSGYRAWKRRGTPARKRLTDAQTLVIIRAIHVERQGAYGSLRIVRELRRRCFTAGKEWIERLMREHGLRARHKRRYQVTTDSKHGPPVADNLLDRNFTPAAPDQVWTSDITYLWTDEGWLYLAIVLDLFNREVIGWWLKPRMTSDIVTDALTMAWFSRWPAAGIMQHSDRGSQYASHVFQGKLKEFGMTCSMSRKGNCWERQRAD